jgi:hypothetical protein
MKKFDFTIHERLDADFVVRLRKSFDLCLSEGRSQDVREGDERIFCFERFIAKPDAKFLFQRHLEYCDSININRPRYMTIMMNKTWYTPMAKGSGGGWHRDSGIKSQHKTFYYLSDVSESSGPFAINDHSSYFLSLLDNPRVRQNDPLTFCVRPDDVTYQKVLGRTGYSFSCRTNFIHRGLPVDSGERYMLTIYAWNSAPPEPFFGYMDLANV